jgi:integrase
MDPAQNNASPSTDADKPGSKSAEAGEGRHQQQRTHVANLVNSFLRDKGKGEAGESGNYRSDAERELSRFVIWLRENDFEKEPTFANLDERTFRRYARHIVGLGNAKGTTLTYYAYVSSFCGWAVDEGYLDRHYANTSLARAPLPEDDGRRPGDQQAWEPEHRDLITRYVDKQAAVAIDALQGGESIYEAVKTCRDRALVYLLCYTAVRGAEIFRDSSDERREGLRWSDINLTDQNITVLRKKQQWDDASLPEPTIHPLRIYESVLDFPDNEWPVFPTLHRPTLAQLVREGLAKQGMIDEEIADTREQYESDVLVCREFDIRPPSLTPNSARRIMKRLCEEVGIELDDQHGYLAPHGGRRGMGEVLVRTYGYTAAARYLDNSEEMVREAYSHIDAGEQADVATAALAESDQRVNTAPDETSVDR